MQFAKKKKKNALFIAFVTLHIICIFTIFLFV